METATHSYYCTSPSPSARELANKAIERYYDGKMPLVDSVHLSGADWHTVRGLIAQDKSYHMMISQSFLNHTSDPEYDYTF